MKSKIAIIGAGVSGLSIAHCLKDRFEVRLFEKESRPGGLIKCDWVDGGLFHRVGGHVFNSRRNDVLQWFWRFFDQDLEFRKTDRNAVVSMQDGRIIGYPIENHAYMMDDQMMKNFVQDLIIKVRQGESRSVENFGDFLRIQFGDTLYENYFQPYNEKVWRRDLTSVPLSWLAGKLPMPTVEEMICNNINHVKEERMVHSSFYYAKKNGSQFIADRLSEGLDIEYNVKIHQLERIHHKWNINGYMCDKIIFCGNVKDIPGLLKSSVDLSSFEKDITDLEYHGTTSVFCILEQNPYSWIYMPSRNHLSHRIICTGNFSPTNNGTFQMTGTVEFTDYISKDEIVVNLRKIPFSPQYISHAYTEYTYPIQNDKTRERIDDLKSFIKPYGIYLLGRFSEWEYYNMDAAIGAAIDLSNHDDFK